MPDELIKPTKTMEKDPVCGMTVDPDRAAAQSARDGKTFYFCSKGCAAKFAAAPEKYLDAPAASSHENDFAVAQSETVPSRPLSTALNPRSKQNPAADYICPMDPEVHQDRPG